MAIVATVVVVGVKLPRPPRVERGRRRWVGGIRRRLLGHGRTFLPGVFIGLGSCASTPTTQTTPAAAMKNVSAPLFAHPVPTKTKLDSPRAKHVQAIRTALPVPPVAHSMPPVVQPVPMPVVLRPFVIHAAQVNTMTKPVKLLVKVVVQGNTKPKLEKHRATIVLVLWYLHWMPDALTTKCTRNERVAIVATVVVVGVKLPRRPRVERGRRRWVGVIRRRVLGQGRTDLTGVFIGLGT